MDPSIASRPLPPGRHGLPLLGETLAFAKNPFRFIDERLAAHGRVFRSHVLGRPTVVLAGPDATSRFIDPELVMREGSMPPHIQEMFGGRSLPLLDGDAHRARKSLVLQGFARAALSAYVPAMQAIVESSFSRWAAQAEVHWLEELKRLSIEVICTTIFDLQPGEEMDGLRRDYGTVTAAFAALPIPLPGTRYSRAMQARDRILAVLARRVKERRAAPAADDGLSRILAARTAAGESLSDDEAVLELHHIVIAGYIVFAELAAIVQQLTGHPDVREKLQEEIRQLAPSGALTVESLAALPYLRQVLMEVKRLCPVIPAVFGRTKTSFEIDQVTIPAGWMVMWALPACHTTHGVYSEPARFDPGRFSPERAEDRRHEHAFVPQGAGPASGHRCAGLDFATYLMAVFAVVLLRGYDWDLPPQSFDYDWSKIPPELVDGLRATVRARHPARPE
jgi:cytochrome P450